MNLPLTGGCACGAVRYECTAEPLIMLNCHCRDCQQASGGPYVAGIIVPPEAFRLTKGELRYFTVDSPPGGKHTRGFCAECGSRVVGVIGNDSPTGICAASLDDPSIFKPRMDIYVSDAQPWTHFDPKLKKFDTSPLK